MTDEEYRALYPPSTAATLDPRLTSAAPLPTSKPGYTGLWTTDLRGLNLPDPTPEPIPEPTEEECQDGLSIKQMKAVECLLQGMNQTKTSEVVEVTRRTVCDWVKQPAFKKVLRARRKEQLASSMNVLQTASLELATNLVKLAKTSVDPADQIRATVQALKMAQEQAFNEDIAERLDAIELSRNADSTDGSTFRVVKRADES